MSETSRWVIGGILASTITWGSWVTNAIYTDRAVLARIEAKLDIVVDKVVNSNKP